MAVSVIFKRLKQTHYGRLSEAREKIGATPFRWRRERLKQLDRDIDGAVRGSELWCHKDELLDSVPGGGTDAARGAVS